MHPRKMPIRNRLGHDVAYASVRYFDDMPKSESGAEVLYHEYGVQLRVSREGQYLLNVLCGKVGQFGVEIALSTEEVARYQEDDGDQFLHDLAEDICENPSAFALRITSHR